MYKCCASRGVWGGMYHPAALTPGRIIPAGVKKCGNVPPRALPGNVQCWRPTTHPRRQQTRPPVTRPREKSSGIIITKGAKYARTFKPVRSSDVVAITPDSRTLRRRDSMQRQPDGPAGAAAVGPLSKLHPFGLNCSGLPRRGPHRTAARSDRNERKAAPSSAAGRETTGISRAAAREFRSLSAQHLEKPTRAQLKNRPKLTDP